MSSISGFPARISELALAIGLVMGLDVSCPGGMAARGNMNPNAEAKAMTTTNDNKKRNVEPGAFQVYARRAADIARLNDVLQMELDAHAARASADPGNWGFAGDLATVRDGLIGLVAMLSKSTRAEIERFLSDAE
jgi:hypothetical protein